MKPAMRAFQPIRFDQPPRRGALLLEIVVSGALLATILIFVSPVMRLTRVQIREADHRMIALAEASNTLDRLCRRPLAELPEGELANVALESAGMNSLPDGRLTVHVEPVPETVAGRRITVEVGYRDAWGQPVTPVRLVGWRFALEEQSQRQSEDQP